MSKVSYMNCWMYSLSIHVAPRRTSISEASRSLGWAAVRASTLTAKAGSCSAARWAWRSFRRTLPDRYSSAVTYWGRSPSGTGPGRRKITPRSSAASSSLVLPVSCSIYAIYTRAFSEMETARASEAVSTVVTASWGLIVRLVNISALRSSLPSSSSTSRAQSR